MQVEAAVQGSPSRTVLTVSVDVKQHREPEPGFLSELRSCVKVEVAVLRPNSP